MKLPRWLVFAMLFSSLLSVLAAAGWWWVTWPERTAEELNALLIAGRFTEADSMIATPKASHIYVSTEWLKVNGMGRFERQTPSLGDRVFGRRIWTCKAPELAITVERGRIRDCIHEGVSHELHFTEP